MVWSCLKQRVHKNHFVGSHIDLPLEGCSRGVCILALKAKHTLQLQGPPCTRLSPTVGVGAQWVALLAVGQQKERWSSSPGGFGPLLRGCCGHLVALGL